MYQPARSPLTVLRFLQGRTYPGLPASLWDRHLWFYDRLRAHLDAPLGGEPPTGAALYAASCRAQTLGVALVQQGADGTDLLLDAVAEDGLLVLAESLARPVWLTTCRQWVADAVGTHWGAKPEPGLVRLYAQRPAQAAGAPVRELDASLALWAGFEEAVALGIRYFGACADGRVVSLCGLWPVSPSRTELIAVHTVEAYRGRGYARAVCAHALQEALQSSAVVTWTTTLPNAASIATARSLGFQPFEAQYTVAIP